jgi:proteasome accessory factor B
VAGRDKVERLANLVTYLLDVERPVPLADIVAKVPGYPAASDSARVQFGRDRDDLRNEGVVIELVTEGNDDRYRIDPATYHLPDLGLTEAETLALRLAAEAVRLEGEDPDEALLKLGTLGTEAPAIVALPSDRRLGGVYEAVRRRSLLCFRYDGVDRVLEPWGVLCRDGFWYVPGFDRTRADQRTFRVDRIDGEVEVGDERDAFEPPAGFDPHRDIPSLPFELSPDEPTEALVAVDAVYARRVVAEVGEDAVVERPADGGVVVRLAVRNPAGFRSWLFGMLDHARVVGPAPMVESVRAWLTSIVEAR